MITRYIERGRKSQSSNVDGLAESLDMIGERNELIEQGATRGTIVLTIDPESR